MSVSSIPSFILAASMIAGANVAYASTITFEDVPENIYFGHPDWYPDKPHGFSSGDYTFTMLDGNGYTFPGSVRYQNTAYNGTSIFDLVGTVTVQNSLGQRFSVESLDFATFITDQQSTVRFTGTRADGTSITRDYATTQLDYYTTDKDFRSQQFNGFNNLVSFEMELLLNPGSSTYAVVFDNIVVKENRSGHVPEPTALALFAVGLGLMAGLGRRKEQH
jgi:hypothetical protein